MLRAILAEVTGLLFVAGLCGGQMPDSTTARRDAAREHNDELFHGHGFDGTGGLHLGAPAIVSTALGIKYWLGDIVPGAVFATVEPGILAFRYGGGYQIYDERVYGVGSAIRLERLTGWRDVLGLARGAQYTGVEVAVAGAFALSFRIGAYRGRGGDGRQLQLTTVDLGIGF